MGALLCGGGSPSVTVIMARAHTTISDTQDGAKTAYHEGPACADVCSSEKDVVKLSVPSA